MPVKRSLKVAGLLKAEISDIIQTRIKDPLVGFVTVTDVVLSDDLKNAKVYFSILGDDKKKERSQKGLNRARKYIQSELASRVRLRYIPSITFYIDETWEYATNIERLLHELHGKASSNST